MAKPIEVAMSRCGSLVVARAITAKVIWPACLLAERRGLRGALVVCPASVKYQWEREVRRFCDRSAVVIEGGRGERARLYDSDVFFKIVNYEAVVDRKSTRLNSSHVKISY